MSFYGANIKTHLIDPVYHNGTSVNPRTEFRLEPNKAYLLNARLANVGCLLASAGVKTYPLYSGVLSLIKHIYATDGKAQIDILRDVNITGMQLNYKTTNSKAIGMELRALGNSLGFQDTETKTTTGEFFYNVDESFKATHSIDTTGRFYFSLSRLLGFFSQVPISKVQTPAFSTQFYKDFRIIIEWNLRNVFDDANVGSILEPLLIVDEVIGPLGEQIANSYMGCKFDAREYERVSLNAITPTEDEQLITREQYYRLDAFKGKYLKSLSWQALIQNDTLFNVEESYSRSLFQEQLRLGINKNWGYLPWENGISNYNLKIGLVTQTLGSLNLVQGMQYPITELQEDDIYDQTSNAYRFLNTGGLGAITIDMPISDLEAYHQRTGLYDEDQNVLLNDPLHIYYLGRVAKVVRPIGNGMYDIFEDLAPYSI